MRLLAPTLATGVASLAFMAQAQQAMPTAPTARVCVVDGAHRPLAGVELLRAPKGVSGTDVAVLLGASGPDGCATFPIFDPAVPHIVQVIYADLSGFASGNTEEPAVDHTATIVLIPDPLQQSITVTAERGLLEVADTSLSVDALTSAQLAAAPGLTLDDSLHQVAGFQLFRRTSSWTANPTSEGVSLRGLGSTAASRTLVVSDQVPLNDPFGGWVHWDEIPTLSLGSITLLRGGATNLYGSSAIGGLIDIVPLAPGELTQSEMFGDGGPHRLSRRDPHAPDTIRVALDGTGATENTGAGDALLVAETHPLLALAALSVLSTEGYVSTAPAARGLVDVPAGVTDEAARIELRPPTDITPWLHTAFLRGNVLNESRSNGTPLTTNATRLWRYQAGADFNGASYNTAVRVFGSREGYRQAFSSVAASRSTESLTKLQRVPSDEVGFAVQSSRGFSFALLGAGVDMRDVRATDTEIPVSATVLGVPTVTSAHQRAVGGFVDGNWNQHGWMVSGSVRVDSFRTFNAQQTIAVTTAPLPELDELVGTPHLGVEHLFGRRAWVAANVFRAFRGPTLNELYRSSQVGSQLTLPNPSLLAERATGYEAGGGIWLPHAGSLRLDGFWTEVNRPISAVLQSGQTYKRENLGQIRSRGAELEWRTGNWSDFNVTASYQLAFATVTAFQGGDLRGKWLPEVPRESAAATLNWGRAHWLNLHAIASYQGEEFDDAENQYLLHPYARFDLSADRELGHGLSVFAGAQNIANRSIQAGRTPVLTLAAPRLVLGGMRYSFGR